MITKVIGSIAVVVLSLCAAGCEGRVVVRTPPPVERVEPVAVAPSAEHFWVKGHWQWVGDQYAWLPGHWEVRRTREVWVPGHWRPYAGGHVWEEGHWVAR
jgi:hypothetical protein